MLLQKSAFAPATIILASCMSLLVACGGSSESKGGESLQSVTQRLGQRAAESVSKTLCECLAPNSGEAYLQCLKDVENFPNGMETQTPSEERKACEKEVLSRDHMAEAVDCWSKYWETRLKFYDECLKNYECEFNDEGVAGWESIYYGCYTQSGRDLSEEYPSTDSISDLHGHYLAVCTETELEAVDIIVDWQSCALE